MTANVSKTGTTAVLTEMGRSYHFNSCSPRAVCLDDGSVDGGGVGGGGGGGGGGGLSVFNVLDIFLFSAPWARNIRCFKKEFKKEIQEENAEITRSTVLKCWGREGLGMGGRGEWWRLTLTSH